MSVETSDLKTRVQEVLNGVRPHLQADGGDVQLIDVVDGVVKVKLQGACHGCPMAAMTLQMGVEKAIKAQIPEIVSVENVVDED